jgi:hypothetical protein
MENSSAVVSAPVFTPHHAKSRSRCAKSSESVLTDGFRNHFLYIGGEYNPQEHSQSCWFAAVVKDGSVCVTDRSGSLDLQA